MPLARADLIQRLTDLRIEQETRDHPAVFTVEESRPLKATMPGGHSKNLFLKDKKGKLTLAVAHAETRVDLVGLGKRLGSAGRLSFGAPELMTETLGVIPGAVTPFAIANPSARALSALILDSALFGFDRVWFHPLENTASTAIAPDDLVRFCRACDFEPLILDLAQPGRS